MGAMQGAGRDDVADLGLFAEADGRSLAALVDHLRRATYKPGDTVMREGEPGDCFLLISQGSAAVLRDGRKVGTAGPGSVVGELALLRGVPRNATVVAA